MKKFLSLIVLFNLLCSPAYSMDHDSKLYRWGVRPIKKIILFPIALVGGIAYGVAGGLTYWYWVSGDEQDWSDAFAGRSR